MVRLRLRQLPTRLREILLSINQDRLIGVSGLTVLCAVSFIGLFPTAVGASMANVAQYLSGLGLNVVASLLERYYQKLSELPHSEEAEEAAILAEMLTEDIKKHPEIREELEEFLYKLDIYGMAAEVIQGNPSAHGWLLLKIARDFDQQGRKLEQYGNQLDEVQTGISRLLVLVQQLVPPALYSDPLTLLAENMRAWFESLNYGFENHNVQGSDYFEWMINIRSWRTRRRYDRILVRGISGEIESGDLQQLRNAVNSAHADYGWLVTTRRVSAAARRVVENPTNSGIYCFTFDELIDTEVDFAGYLDWLENEIHQRKIEELYVPLSCVKEEFDPDTHEKIDEGVYDEANGGIDAYLDRWLADPSKEHISILGEFGTGKTWFVFHYAWRVLQKYRDAVARGIDRPRLPLVIPLRDYAKAVSVESLFSEFFFRKHNLGISSYRAFEQLNKMGKFLLLFDGFDEMAARIDRQKMINNFWELAQVVTPGAKAVLTCRTEHFPEAQEGRALLNAELQASTALLTGEPPQFEVLKLLPFDVPQIREILGRRSDQGTTTRIMESPELVELASRPIMIEYILDSLPAIEAGKPIDISRVYLYAVHHKLERDIAEARTFTSLADKLYFMCEVCWEMFSTNRTSLNYRLFPERLRSLFGQAVVEERDLDHWHYDMMGQTLLIRNDDGDYTPAHRSLLEFFICYKLAAELGVLAYDFTVLAKARSPSDIKPGEETQSYTWSSYFRRVADENGHVERIAPLDRFITEPILELGKTVGAQPLSPAVISLILPMLKPDVEQVNETLLATIYSTREVPWEQNASTGGNIATIMLHRDPDSLQGLDLSNTNLADMSAPSLSPSRGCNLNATNFEGSNLAGAQFREALLRGTNFRRAFLEGATINGFENDDASLSPDGRNLAVCSFGDIVVYDTDLDTMKSRVNESQIWKVQYSPDGKYLVSGMLQGVAVRDPLTLEILYSLPISEKHVSKHSVDARESVSAISAIEFISDSNRLAIATSRGEVQLWDLDPPEHVQTLTLNKQASIILSLAVNRKNTYLAIAIPQHIYVWDLTRSEMVQEMSVSYRSTAMAFHPSTDALAIRTTENTIALYDVSTKGLGLLSQLRFAALPIAKADLRLSFSPTGSLICAAGSTTFAFFDLNTLEDIYVYEKRPAKVPESFTRFHPLPNGFLIRAGMGYFLSEDKAVVVHGDGNVNLVDVHTRKITHSLKHMIDLSGADFTDAQGISAWLRRKISIHEGKTR